MRFPAFDILRAGMLCAIAALAAGCTFVLRSLTYPGVDPVLDVDWYEPCDRVAGGELRDLPSARPDEIEIPREAFERAVAMSVEHDSCALLVLHRGRIVLERYWCGLDRESRVQTFSMAKTVVALLLGKAIEQGHIASVDEPVERLLNEWRGDRRGRITIRQLLQMSSGLAQGSMIRIHIGTDALAAVLATPLERPPGTAFEYNNVNSQLLSAVLERATGKRYADYLSEALWKPMGGSEAAVWLDKPGGTAKTYCCLMTTARDWARVGLLMMQRGRVDDRQVVPAAWIDKMLEPSPLEESYGFHLWLGYTRPKHREKDWSVPFAASDTFLLVGREEQRVYVIPSRQLVIVRIGHESEDWDDPLLPNILVESLNARGSTPAPDMEGDGHASPSPPGTGPDGFAPSGWREENP